MASPSPARSCQRAAGLPGNCLPGRRRHLGPPSDEAMVPSLFASAPSSARGPRLGPPQNEALVPSWQPSAPAPARGLSPSVRRGASPRPEWPAASVGPARGGPSPGPGPRQSASSWSPAWGLPATAAPSAAQLDESQIRRRLFEECEREVAAAHWQLAAAAADAPPAAGSPSTPRTPRTTRARSADRLQEASDGTLVMKKSMRSNPRMHAASVGNIGDILEARSLTPSRRTRELRRFHEEPSATRTAPRPKEDAYAAREECRYFRPPRDGREPRPGASRCDETGSQAWATAAAGATRLRHDTPGGLQQSLGRSMIPVPDYDARYRFNASGTSLPATAALAGDACNAVPPSPRGRRPFALKNSSSLSANSSVGLGFGGPCSPQPAPDAAPGRPPSDPTGLSLLEDPKVKASCRYHGLGGRALSAGRARRAAGALNLSSGCARARP